MAARCFLVAPIGAVSEFDGQEEHVVIAEGRPVRGATDCEVWLADQLHIARRALQGIARDLHEGSPALTRQALAREALGKMPEANGISLRVRTGPYGGLAGEHDGE